MNKLMTYKDYHGSVEYSNEDEVFYGKVVGINDLVTFEGSSVKELKSAFKYAIEDYIQSCIEMAKEPEKEYRGLFNVRISGELHRKAAKYAAMQNITLNKFVALAIENAVEA